MKSKKNITSFKKGHKQLNTGRTWFRKGRVSNRKEVRLSKEIKKKMSLSKKGKHYSLKTEFKKGGNLNEKNSNWKGKMVGYYGLHAWVKRHKGKPKKCEMCNKYISDLRKIHWANIDHKYHRDLNNWIRLCSECHKKYDKDLKVKRRESELG